MRRLGSILFAVTAVALLYRLQPHMRELEASLLYLAQVEPQLRSVRLMLSADDKDYPKPGYYPVTSLSDRTGGDVSTAPFM